MSRKVVIPLLLSVAVVAAAGGYLYYFRAPPAVTVTPVERGPVVEAVYATGVVEPVHWAKVAPAVTGRIREIRARDGDRVEAGEVLLRLDDEEACARLAEAEARERFLGQEVERLRTLFERGVVSRQALDRAMSEHDQAVAAVAAARQCVNDRTIRSPIDGVVLRQDGEIGEVVDTDDVLFWVGRPRPLRITAEVDEEDIPLVEPGQTVLVRADAFPGRDLEGTVGQITPQGDPVTKAYRVRIALPADTPLMPGMTTEVNVVVREEPDAMLVPASAVVDGHVWVVRAGSAARVPVTIGVKGRKAWEVRQGLGGDELVIVVPPDDLAEGEEVRPRRADRA